MAAFIALRQTGRAGRILARCGRNKGICENLSKSSTGETPYLTSGRILFYTPIKTYSATATDKTDLAVKETKLKDEFVERFVPITRKSIIRLLMQEERFLLDEELRNFEDFSLALDAAIVNRHHALLQELKTLFDPINPDKDTIATRQWNRREKLDNEFWLLQKLGAVMSKANFHELSKHLVKSSLKQHRAKNGVMVSVNPDKYDVLSMWALGKETPAVSTTTLQNLINKLRGVSTPPPLEYYKRVVLACRLKRDDKLLLKAFKEVPVNALEQLLPDGKVSMTRFDQGMIYSSLGIAATGIIAKIVTILAGVHFDWSLLLTGVTGLIAVRAWTSHKNKHLKYLNEHSRMFFFKNIANNRGLLTLLVDRAEDEVFKEAIMVYTFLLTNRPPSVHEDGEDSTVPPERGGMSQLLLEKKLEEWILNKTGHKIDFESEEAFKLLSEFGLLSEDLNGDLFVLPLEAAMRNLPQTPKTITSRVEEYDIVEGYDRDITDEKESEYKVEEKKRKKYGWF